MANSALQAGIGTGDGLILIEEIVVGAGGAASVDFQNIPQGYKHLEIFAQAQSEGGAAAGLRMNFNNDTGSNYYWQQLLSTGTGVATQEGEATTSFITVLPATGEAQMVSVKISIPYYARSAKRKVALSESFTYRDSDGRLEQVGMLWTDDEPITRITLTLAGTDIKEDSIFSLYALATGSAPQGLADHIADAIAAHAATAIAFTPAGTIAADNVQDAIEEVASEGGGGGIGDTLALYIFTK